MKVDKIIGSLETFEVSINGRSENKNKGINFVSNTQEKKYLYEKDIEEILSYDLSYIGRKFNNGLKNLDRNKRINVLGKRSINSPLNKTKDNKKYNKGKEA